MKFTKTNSLTRMLRLVAGSLIVACTFFVGPLRAAIDDAGELQIQKCWESKFKGLGGGKLGSGGSAVLVVRDGSFIDALSAENGSKLWTSDIGGEIDSNIAVGDGVLFIARKSIASGEGRSEAAVLRALSTTTGVTRWSAFTDGNEGFSLKLSGTSILLTAKNGTVQSFRSSDGVSEWKIKLDTAPTVTPSKFGDQSLLYAAGKELLTIRTGATQPELAASTEFPVTTTEAFDGKIAWGDDRGNMILSSGPKGRIEWQFKSGGSVSDIISIGGKVIASSNDNFVYAISPGNGNRIWKRRVAGRVSAIRPVAEDTILVQPVGDDNFVLLRVGDGKVVGQIPVSDGEFVADAAVLDGGNIIVLTDAGVYAYAVGSCNSNKKSGPDVTPANRSQ